MHDFDACVCRQNPRPKGEIRNELTVQGVDVDEKWFIVSVHGATSEHGTPGQCRLLAMSTAEQGKLLEA